MLMNLFYLLSVHYAKKKPIKTITKWLLPPYFEIQLIFCPIFFILPDENLL